jgi:hypothetical protein
MQTIEIDFDVFKELTIRRKTEETTYNDVLRELLGLNPKKQQTTPTGPDSGKGGWIQKGVRFPQGTDFRATYKGENYYGKVDGGALVVDGQRFNSVSSAAVSITGNSVNGWIFWECRYPGSNSWKIIKSLR